MAGIDTQKMLLNDVAVKNSTQIPSLEEIKEKDSESSASITITIPNYQLRELLEFSIIMYKDQRYVNGIIVNAIEDLHKRIQIQHQTTSLTFNGEDRIRKDVLLKLKSIAEYFESSSSYPLIKIHTIKQSIETVLGRVDPRTKEKYLNSIKIWLRKAKGKESYYNSELDLSGFKQAVLNKLEN